MTFFEAFAKGAAVVAAWCSLSFAAASAAPPLLDASHEWFSVLIEVAGLPPDAPPTPVSCPLDCRAVAEKLGAKGAVDERTLRLFCLAPGGREFEQPVQFLCQDQPAAKSRQFLPGTVPGVSYIAEYAAGEVVATPHVKGALWWIARCNPEGRPRYRLRFGVLRRGRTIQVPYPPHDLRMFDEAGRATPVPYFPRMQIRPQWPLLGTLDITDNGSRVTTYHVGPAWDRRAADEPVIRRPFFYPVNGPQGISLTELGKPHDPTGRHRHHYSLWIAHNNVGGHNFWAEQGGIIAHRQIELLEDGPVFCRLAVRTVWRDGPTECLDERRSLTVFQAGEGFRCMDLDLQFSPAGKQAVELGRTSFGFLAVRVAQSMTPFDGGGEILNANGQRNEQNAHLQHAAWLDQSGPITSEAWAGIAMLDHPRNVNHPTGWHCRNDGWAGASFNLDGPYRIEIGKPLHLRYRLVLHAGTAEEAKIEGHWKGYAAEPSVRVGEPQREAER